MSTQVSPGTERFLARAVDIGERLFILLLFVPFAMSVARSFELRP